jgi:PAS domain S-box-containing protein
MQIFTRVKNIFKIPEFPDEEKNRIAGIINTITIAAFGGLFFLILQRLIVGKLYNLTPIIVFSILLFITLIVNSKKQIKPAGFLLIGSLFGIFIYLILMYDGIHGTAILLYPGLLVLAGLILNKSNYIIFSFTSLSLIILIGILEIYRIVETRYNIKTNYYDIMDLTVILSITALCVRLLSDNISKSLELAHKREDEYKIQAINLKISEERYRKLVDSVTDYIYTVRLKDGKPSITLHGTGCVAVTGYTSEEYSLDPHLWIRMVYEEDKKAVFELGEKILSGIDVLPLEHRIIHKNGSLRWVRNTPVLHYNEQGIITSYDGLITDITERKNAEEKLKQKVIELNGIFQALPDLYFKMEKDGTIIDFKAGYKIDFYVSPDSLLGNKVQLFLPPIVAQKFDNALDDVLKGKAQVSIEYDLPTSERDYFYEARILALENKQIIAFIRDITDRKLTEKALQNSQSFLNSIFEQSPSSMWLSDETGTLIRLNKACKDLLAISDEDVVGKYNVLQDNIVEQQGFIPIIKNVFENGETARFELHYNSKQLKTLELKKFKDLILDVTIYPIKDVNGKIRNAVIQHSDITERKKTEEALLQSELRYRHLYEDAPIGIYRTTPEGNIIFCNPHLINMLGYDSFDELAVRNLNNEGYNPNYSRNDFINEIEKEGAIKGLEAGWHKKDGSIIFIREYSNVVKDLNGKTLYYDGFVEDITEQKYAELALRESNRKLNTTVNNLKGFIYRCKNDSDWTMEYISKGVLELSEYAAEDFLLNKRYTYNSIIEAEDRTMVWDIVQQSISLKESYTIEYRIHTASGSIKWVWEKGSGVFENDVLVALEGFVTDITDRKLIEKAFQESEIKFRDLVEQINDVIFTLNVEGIITYISPVAESIIGFKTEEIIGHSIKEFIYPDFSKDLIKRFKSIYSGFLKQLEYKLKTKSGEYIWVRSSSKPIFDGKKPIGLRGVMTDITSGKKIEQELEKYRLQLEELIKERTKELEEVNILLQQEIVKQKEAEAKVKIAWEKEKELSELKSKFISIASHEFRTPLTTVLSSTELLERYGRSWELEVYKKQIERIKKSVKYLTNLMDEVLLISHSDSGKLKLDLRPIDIEKLCKNILEDIQSLLAEKHKLNFQIDISSKKMLFDEKLLKFIISNLLSNAIKYSPAGGEVGFIVTEKEGQLNLVISDEGIGIPEEDKVHLFDSFSRGSNVGEIHGTGLGMSIVKRSVDMFNGSIEFESEINKGTKFIVTIPVSK